jgi:hypothetical protein
MDFDQIRRVKIPNLKYIGGVAVPEKLPEENEVK